VARKRYNMGLLANIEKKEKEQAKKKSDKEVDFSSIKKDIKKSISKQETKHVDKPTVKMVGGKVQTLRPKGTLERIKQQVQEATKRIAEGKQVSEKTAEEKPKEQPKEAAPKGPMNLAAIKAQIEAKLKGKKTGGKKPAQTKVAKDRAGTGIPGLDEVMEGGFRNNTVTLVGGGAGSGKTIFAMQFLINGIDECDEPGVYISFEQTEDEILEDMGGFSWELKKRIDDKKLTIMTYTPEQVEKVLRAGGGTVRDVIESINAKRIVIDSLTAFTLLHKDNLAQRKACIQLFEAIKNWKCTALLIAENEQYPDSHKSSVEEFEVDGVILLYNLRRGDVRERALEIFKMRGSKHSAKIFPMTVSEDGIVIYPDQTIF